LESVLFLKKRREKREEKRERREKREEKSEQIDVRCCFR
jgi:hypothetical protein